MISIQEIEDFLVSIEKTGSVDARSEAEFAAGHIPGSINIPLLTNEHRVEVGTLYKQMGKEAAVMKGFQLAGPRFYQIFKTLRKHAVQQETAIYCWRGGMRSNILSWMLNLADYKVNMLKGGYKAYRQYAHALFERPFKWTVLSGKTGVGKTKLLHQLAQAGEQVLDFEALANHKGSAFGHIGQPEQPSVEHFENLIAWQLRRFDMAKPVWIESESRLIGKVRIPDALFDRTMASPVIEATIEEEKRRIFIWEEYGQHPVENLVECTERLQKKLGGDRMKEACNALLADNWQGWLDILIPYYDKTYSHSEKVRTGEKYTLQLTGTDAMDAQSLIALKNNIWKQA
jgi:tRNA 2-selenouridine synthase